MKLFDRYQSNFHIFHCNKLSPLNFWSLERIVREGIPDDIVAASYLGVFDMVWLTRLSTDEF